MGLILKIIIGFLVLGIVITIFQNVTGIDITGGADKKEEKEYSPLEMELKEIELGAYGRVNIIAKYVAAYYKESYVELGDSTSFASIDTIVSKYVDNQLLFSEKYEDHVIALTDKVEFIGKEDEDVYISIGDGKHYGLFGAQSLARSINCYLDKSDMEDDNYKDLVLNMRPGMEVTLVGVLSKRKYGGFDLYGTTLIEVGGVVPDIIMNIAVNTIYDKYKAQS